ncbi:MAG: CsgG/HfaB family protein [bacterium]
MKKFALVIITVLISSNLISQTKKVAIFDPVDKTSSEMGVIYREILSTNMTKSESYIPVERELIDNVLKESEYQGSGMVNESTASKLGKQMGADYVCVSMIMKMGSNYFLTAKLVDVETAVVKIQEQIKVENKEKLYDKMVELSGKLFKVKNITSVSEKLDFEKEEFLNFGNKVKGDFNGDGEIDYVKLKIVGQKEEKWVGGSKVMKNIYSLVTLNLNVEPLDLGIGTREPYLINEGDLNNDGADALSVFYPPENGNYYFIQIFTISNKEWKERYESIGARMDGPPRKDIIFKKDNTAYYYDTFNKENKKLKKKN